MSAELNATAAIAIAAAVVSNDTSAAAIVVPALNSAAATPANFTGQTEEVVPWGDTPYTPDAQVRKPSRLDTLTPEARALLIMFNDEIVPAFTKVCAAQEAAKAKGVAPDQALVKEGKKLGAERKAAIDKLTKHFKDAGLEFDPKYKSKAAAAAKNKRAIVPAAAKVEKQEVTEPVAGGTNETASVPVVEETKKQIDAASNPRKSKKKGTRGGKAEAGQPVAESTNDNSTKSTTVVVVRKEKCEGCIKLGSRVGQLSGQVNSLTCQVFGERDLLARIAELEAALDTAVSERDHAESLLAIEMEKCEEFSIICGELERQHAEQEVKVASLVCAGKSDVVAVTPSDKPACAEVAITLPAVADSGDAKAQALTSTESTIVEKVAEVAPAKVVEPTAAPVKAAEVIVVTAVATATPQPTAVVATEAAKASQPSTPPVAVVAPLPEGHGLLQPRANPHCKGGSCCPGWVLFPMGGVLAIQFCLAHADRLNGNDGLPLGKGRCCLRSKPDPNCHLAHAGDFKEKALAAAANPSG